jgi:transposase
VNTYSEAFKRNLVQRMMLPHSPLLSELADETGVSQTTLHRWRSEARIRGVSIDRPDKPASTTQPPSAWSAEDKLAVVLEAAAIPDAELGAFLRRKGVHEAQLAEWRRQVTEGAVAALRGPSRADRKGATSDARRVRELEREIRRKDKALAETAALLVLKKKVQELWGDEDDDTTPESDK